MAPIELVPTALPVERVRSTLSAKSIVARIRTSVPGMCRKAGPELHAAKPGMAGSGKQVQVQRRWSAKKTNHSHPVHDGPWVAALHWWEDLPGQQWWW